MSDGRTVGRSDGREGQTFGGESLVTRYVNFVKLPHTIFALPFALLGVIVASYKQPVTWRVAILVIVAFTAARFVAMGFNRIADRRLDARNPRTQGRELPTGRLTISQAWAAVLGAMVVPLLNNLINREGFDNDVIPLIIGLTLLLGTIVDEFVRRRSRLNR